jgi:hypothetical protein
MLTRLFMCGDCVMGGKTGRNCVIKAFLIKYLENKV